MVILASELRPGLVHLCLNLGPIRDYLLALGIFLESLTVRVFI